MLLLCRTNLVKFYQINTSSDIFFIKNSNIALAIQKIIIIKEVKKLFTGSFVMYILKALNH
jgi:hypothetical protein